MQISYILFFYFVFHAEFLKPATCQVFVSNAQSPIRRAVSIQSIAGGQRKIFHVVNYGLVTEPPADTPPSASLTMGSSVFHIYHPSDVTTYAGDNNCNILNDYDQPLQFTDTDTPIRRRFEKYTNGFAQSTKAADDELKEVVVLSPSALSDTLSAEVGSNINQKTNIIHDQWLDRSEIAAVAKRGRLYAGRKTKRLMSKDGTVNMTMTDVPLGRGARYLTDIFTTLLELRWLSHIVLFTGTFLFFWFAFALAWWLVSVEHGDPWHRNDTQWVPCVQGVYDFTTALLFSLEVQQTIGFGTRATTDACPVAVWLIMTQSLVGVMIQCIMSGLIFAKLARPKQRSRTISFSTRAVICEIDGQLYWQCRVTDLRKSHMVSIDVKAIVLVQKSFEESDGIPFHQRDLKVVTDLESEFFFFAWPMKIVHRINKHSPLWNLTAESLLAASFEIVVVFEGVSQETGMITQVRTSYLPSEIMWGHRFAPVFKKRRENGTYVVDYSRFNETIPTEMSDVSAKQRYDNTLPILDRHLVT